MIIKWAPTNSCYLPLGINWFKTRLKESLSEYYVKLHRMEDILTKQGFQLFYKYVRNIDLKGERTLSELHCVKCKYFIEHRYNSGCPCDIVQYPTTKLCNKFIDYFNPYTDRMESIWLKNIGVLCHNIENKKDEEKISNSSIVKKLIEIGLLKYER